MYANMYAVCFKNCLYKVMQEDLLFCLYNFNNMSCLDGTGSISARYKYTNKLES